MAISTALHSCLIFLIEYVFLKTITEALKAYEHKPDCFKKAARALRKECKSVDMDEDEKMKFAIRLAACEIATANMPVPVDCRALSPEGEQAQSESATPANIRRCVQYGLRIAHF
ncbi:hypothetical protein BCR41DRAFT_370826 [Lobosporangium transversale]|uniref:Uncharacterized protein n=1 Tax=Lobosporangium transversale TaxID=64571 RepID=A0A1Y2GMF5_9FUNG|nr:hypothetical protein BCR41DRAFT_370826 [Lobosporangium transversale]ORZ15467.1 hypothetical protein BCR41DRAFT_370826 [Lobosporangium transversale]|eukprot:XP_021881215.1 hypothetical protein BCR41DRAFT_370826 [Lobosporangium transversale]